MSTTAPLQNTPVNSQSLSDMPQSWMLLQRKCISSLQKPALTDENEGNKCIKHLQAKLSVGNSNDPLEQEADRVADQVLTAPAHLTVSTATPRIQRLTAQSNGQTVAAPGSVDQVLANSGRPMDSALQQDMGQRFNYDFSQVKVHTGAAADQSVRDVNAKAYTVGNNIVFGAGRFAPGTHAGRRLIAHELTHVVQQSSFGSASGVIARAPADEIPWIQDQDGALYYKTPAQAERRMAALKENDEWQHLRVTSFKLKGTTFWRVEMRGRKSTTPPAPAQAAPAANAPSGKIATGVSANLTNDSADAGTVRDAGSVASEGATAAATGSVVAGSAVGSGVAAGVGAGVAGAAAAGATRVFSLTFDDGPHSAKLGAGSNLTENVMDTLKAKGVKAGFFIQTGVSFRGANPVGRALVNRMQTEGHTVGIHTGGTTDHEAHPSAQKAGRLESELKAAQSYVTQQTGSAPTLVRPPFGASNKAVDAVYKKVGLNNLLWDIDGDKGAASLSQLKTRLNSADPKDPGIPAVQARGWTGTTAAHPKIVVLYHDIRANTSSNIGDVIDHIRAETKAVSGGKDTADFAPP